MTLSMDDVLAIVKPHNDKIVAEHKLAMAEREIEGLYVRILNLKAALGACAALMQFDVDEGRTPLTDTRRDVLAKARELSEYGR
jgi:hypothetical protein